MDLKYQLLQAVSLTNGQVRGRYAPSPSGIQHLGNIRSALVAWLQARLAGGRFALRMDDIDTPRIRPGSAEQIIDDLSWLGLDWDLLDTIEYAPDAQGVYVESLYLEFYHEALAKLDARGLIYPCRCSRKQVMQRVGKPNVAGHYVYPGTCRGRPRESFHAGESLAWRFRAPAEEIVFVDMLAGEQRQDVAREWGDIILRRRDDLFAYQLVSVVDDIQMGITDVVRGIDLLDSTPGQVALFRALGAEPPRFWHMPLKTDAAGNKLAKRDGSQSLLELREAGYQPEQVVGQLAHELGLAGKAEPISLVDLLGKLRGEAPDASG